VAGLSVMVAVMEVFISLRDEAPTCCRSLACTKCPSGVQAWFAGLQ